MKIRSEASAPGLEPGGVYLLQICDTQGYHVSLTQTSAERIFVARARHQQWPLESAKHARSSRPAARVAIKTQVSGD
jgi:hypothetical protein